MTSTGRRGISSRIEQRNQALLDGSGGVVQGLCDVRRFKVWQSSHHLVRGHSVSDCYDNAPMESFWGSMQIELLNRQTWRTKMELGLAMADYIEHFYNSDRRHSSLGYRTPNEFEDLHSTTTQPATLS
jgi:hypothetical protein